MEEAEHKALHAIAEATSPTWAPASSLTKLVRLVVLPEYQLQTLAKQVVDVPLLTTGPVGPIILDDVDIATWSFSSRFGWIWFSYLARLGH